MAQVVAARGAELGASWARRQVRLRPGHSVVVEFTLELIENGAPRRAILTIASGLEPLPGAMVGAAGGIDYQWWWFPDDPLLPGLAPLLDPERRRRLLSQVGIDDEVHAVRTRAYRANRRAVVELRAGRHRIFAKVVPAELAGPLHDRHRRVEGLLPCPPSHGIAREAGIVLLGAVPGVPLRTVLEDREWYEPATVSGLADRIGELDPSGLPELRGPGSRLEGFRRLFSVIAPEADAVIDELQAGRDHFAVTQTRPVHGDFHAGQVMIDPDHPMAPGLVDIDTLAVGDPIIDRAAMLAQLTLLADQDRRYLPFLTALAEVWAPLDPAGRLDAWTAAHMVGLATGPFRAQEKEWRSATRHRLDRAAIVAREGVAVR